MNLKVRIKNPVFWVQIVLAAAILMVCATPSASAAAVTGKTAKQITTQMVRAVSNPYVLSLVAVSVWNTLNDPTTKGLGDSERAKSYTDPQ